MQHVSSTAVHVAAVAALGGSALAATVMYRLIVPLDGGLRSHQGSERPIGLIHFSTVQFWHVMLRERSYLY